MFVFQIFVWRRICKSSLLYHSSLIIKLYFSPVIYSYLSILPDDNPDIFAASLLISYYRFSSLIVSSFVMISFYILSKRFFLKRKRLSDAKGPLMIITEYLFVAHFL